ncbi:MAG: hypothetical protein WC405_09060 [Syntrophales bacterium]
METQLYFWKPLIEQYQNDLSLVEEYYKHTMVVFSDIEKDAEGYAKEFYENYPATEATDPASVAEWAEEISIEKYQSLSAMKFNHLLMTISMLYQAWEQQLIKFMIHELHRYIRFDKRTVSFNDVQTVFRLHGVDILKTESWVKIRELKFLVNTIKHGDGDSANKLRKIRPDYFRFPDRFKMGKETDSLDLYGSVLFDEHSLQVSDTDLYSYIEATKKFWGEMPERAYSNTETLIEELTKERGRQ